MLETITAVNQAVNSFIWGIPAMVCIIGVGLLLSVRTGFLQLRKFPYAIKTTIGRIFRKKDASDGAMTPFQAVCTALAATVGTGNIAGVAGAIAIGGPGAVFWMWCSALLGMCTKFSEVTLAVHFRERNKNGELVGGPMYYIKNGLGSRWQFLAVLYSLFGVLTVFGTGNATQVNTIVTAIDSALLAYGSSLNSILPTVNLVVGVVVAMMVAMVLLGGVKRIGSVTEKLVPFMALFYVVLALGVVVINYRRFPAVLASIGTSRSAKRATIIHLMFNMIGTVIFTFLFIMFPIAHVIDGQIPVAGLSGILPSTPAGQIAMVHTSFNIVTTLLLLPLGNYLAKAAVRILPDRPGDKVDQMHLEYLTPIQISSKDGGLGVSAIYVDQMQHELRRMMLMAQGNVEASFRSVLNRDENELAEVEKTEEYIDFLNKEISLHVSRLIAYETNEKASAVVSSFFTISGNIERIGDHADNLAGYTRLLNKRNISFSPAAQKEIAAMRDICLECVDYLLTPVAGNVEWLSEVSALEQRIDDMTSDYRRSHLERMRSGECSDEACIIYSELLTDFERIGDHVLNIAQEMAQVQEHI